MLSAHGICISHWVGQGQMLREGTFARGTKEHQSKTANFSTWIYVQDLCKQLCQPSPSFWHCRPPAARPLGPYVVGLPCCALLSRRQTNSSSQVWDRLGQVLLLELEAETKHTQEFELTPEETTPEGWEEGSVPHS